MDSPITVYVDNDNLVIVTVQNASDETYPDDATVTFDACDEDGVSLANGTGNCSYQAGTDGVYHGTLDDAFAGTDGQDGILKVDVAADSLTAHVEALVTYRTRR